ncbi:MAG: hypothetical protein JSV98_05650 [candidate division WOR-3 bacterium]|nr:MAG: hypothetical protein JSV98_05650 [candidate division WOR-3 bacterium]
MTQRTRIPRRFAMIGGYLIIASGIVNAALGMNIGALYYAPYPGGNMGHVGILAGIVAIIIGLIIVFLVVPLYHSQKRAYIALAGLLTVILGHLGAVAGAIYVGTAGLLLCYIGGFWAIVLGLFSHRRPQDVG